MLLESYFVYLCQRGYLVVRLYNFHINSGGLLQMLNLQINIYTQKQVPYFSEYKVHRIIRCNIN